MCSRRCASRSGSSMCCRSCCASGPTGRRADRHRGRVVRADDRRIRTRGRRPEHEPRRAADQPRDGHRRAARARGGGASIYQIAAGRTTHDLAAAGHRAARRQIARRAVSGFDRREHPAFDHSVCGSESRRRLCARWRCARARRRVGAAGRRRRAGEDRAGRRARRPGDRGSARARTARRIRRII